MDKGFSPFEPPPSGKEHRFWWSGTILDYISGNPAERFRTYEEYRKQFRVPCNVKYTFDDSPQSLFIGNPYLHPHKYFRHNSSTKSVHEVRSFLGSNVKLILVIRDPYDWLSSQNAIGNEIAEKMSCFADSLETWLQVFPRENFLFLKFEEIFRDVTSTMDTVFEFAGAPPFKASAVAASGRRRNTVNQDMAAQDRARFHSAPTQKECKSRLEGLTGLQFDWGFTA